MKIMNQGKAKKTDRSNFLWILSLLTCQSFSPLHPLSLSTTTSARPFTYYSASFVSESITDVLSFNLPVLSETTRTDWTCCSGWVYLSQNRKLLYPSRVSQDHLSGSATSTSRLWAR